jgi:hypothetical protein
MSQSTRAVVPVNAVGVTVLFDGVGRLPGQQLADETGTSGAINAAEPNDGRRHGARRKQLLCFEQPAAAEMRGLGG